MGKRGPPKKPTRLKLVQGTDRADRRAQNEPQPEPDLPERPDWLDEYATAFWDEWAPKLYQNGLLTELDAVALEMMAQKYAEWRRAQDMLPDEPFQVSDKGWAQKHPWVTIENEAFKELKVMLAHFGMTPSSRSSINLPDKPKQDTDSEFLFRGEASK